MTRTTRQVSPSGARAARVGQSQPGSANGPTRQRRADKARLIAALDRLLETPEPNGRGRDTESAIRYLETVRGFSPPAPPMSSAERLKILETQADQVAGVIRSVLKELHLSDADYQRGIELASKGLRAASPQGWEPL
jgi:hypothetical protein